MKNTNANMRIVQIIDSLEAGGAERMAVNYANALLSHIEFSGLVATRAEGLLKNDISDDVAYLFLRKQKSFDLATIKKLSTYLKENSIDVIHAHSTSIYLAVMAKFLVPKIKIVWHDHYGNSEFLKQRSSKILRFALKFCSGAIAVNTKLELWIKQYLHFSNTIYLPNFASLELAESTTVLGGIDNFRIICVANLREQKNHFLLLNVAVMLKKTHPKWTFHFVGKDFNDDYAQQVKDLIKKRDLEHSVFLYGSCVDTAALLNKCDIAVLSSKSEGLPVAILEYGLLSKPVLATSVGEISSIIKDGENGYLAPSGNDSEFYNKLVLLIEDKNRFRFGNELNKTISKIYSEEFIIETYLKWLNNL